VFKKEPSIEELQKQTMRALETAQILKKASEHLKTKPVGGKGRSGKMVENVVLTLTGIFCHVSRWEDEIKPVNISDLTMPPKENAKPRFLAGREIKRLITASRGVFRSILLFIAMTGMRINEVSGLPVEDVDFENKFIHVTKSAYNGALGTPKSDVNLTDISLSAELAMALRNRLRSKHFRKNPLGVLFANRCLHPVSDDKQYLWPLLRSLEMKQVGFHAIRHGVASGLLNSGLSDASVCGVAIASLSILEKSLQLRSLG